MKLIAHRGNIHGVTTWENLPSEVEKCINKGFDAEVDIWKIGTKWWLGHDRPHYLVPYTWLIKHRDSLWLHCKNFEALDQLVHLDDRLNFFWHENDDYALTSQGYIWIYPEVYSNNLLYAWCSDYVGDMHVTKNKES